MLDRVIDSGAQRAVAPAASLFARGALAGALLSCATVLSYAATTQTGLPLIGAIVFPIGFVVIMLLGLELVTGNFAVVPLAMLAHRARGRDFARNATWVLLGHFAGAGVFIGLFAAGATDFGRTPEGHSATSAVIAMIVSTAETKTTGYAALGALGLAVVFVKAMLCNWLVTIGAMLNYAADDTAGRVLAMWLPVTMFYVLGLEHAVVNLFVIPAGIVLGADVTAAQWWAWNQVPALGGNLAGALLLTVLPLWWAHRRDV